MFENIIFYVALPIIVGVGGWLSRWAMTKLENIEQEMQTKVTEEDVRQAIVDKIEPINKALDNINKSLDRLLDLYLQITKNNFKE